MKRVRIFNLLILVLSLFLVSNLKFSGASDIVLTGDAGYRRLERVTDEDLGFDVKHYFDKGESYRDGNFYPQEVNILEVPYASNARIVSFGNLQNSQWTLTTVGDLVKLYEATHPNQKVLAAVNADFYDINGNGNFPYQTSNPLVTDGEYFRTSGSNAVGIRKASGTSALVGGSPTRTNKMILSIYDENDQIIKEFQIDKVNSYPSANETSVFYALYDANSRIVPVTLVSTSSMYVVENAEYALPNGANDFYGRGVISSIAPTTLAKGQFAIVTNNEEIKQYLSVDVKIRVQHKLTGIFEGVDNVTGHNAKFLEKGEYNPHPNSSNNTYARHPRTVVGVKRDGTIVLAIIDGRQEAKGKYGMYGNEMAAFMKSLNVVDAYNLDGGGSSYMVIRRNGEFVIPSSPADGNPRKVANALLVVVDLPDTDIKINQNLNYLDFNINLKDAKGFDIQELYVKVNDNLKLVENGKATITNLDANTEYKYEIYYKDSKGNVNSTLIDGKVKTLKQDVTVSYIMITEEEDHFKLELVYTDPDNATNLANAIIYINEKKYTFQQAKLTIAKATFNDIFRKFALEYTINDNATEKDIVLEKVIYRINGSITTENLYEILRMYNEKILDFYS